MERRRGKEGGLTERELKELYDGLCVRTGSNVLYFQRASNICVPNNAHIILYIPHIPANACKIVMAFLDCILISGLNYNVIFEY